MSRLYNMIWRKIKLIGYNLIYTSFQWTEDRQGFQIQYLTVDTWPDNIHDADSTEIHRAWADLNQTH